MPTSGAAEPFAASGTAEAAAFWKSDAERTGTPPDVGGAGGQSVPVSRALLPGPKSGASSSSRWFGLRSGQIGKSNAEEGRARRRTRKPGAVGEGRDELTGDIAHLETARVFRFLFAMSRTISFFLRRAVFSAPIVDLCRDRLPARLVFLTPFWCNPSGFRL
jgi:hypothetical protein